MLQAAKRQDSIRALFERLGPMQFEVPGIKSSKLKRSAVKFAPLGKWQFDFAVAERRYPRAPFGHAGEVPYQKLRLTFGFVHLQSYPSEPL